MDSETDAFGAILRAHHRGEESYEIVERDDGWIGPSAGAEAYFSEYGEWPARQQRAVDRAEGRVLDVGCGAGRHALELQERGHEVVGVDLSPGAVAVARDRGVERVERADVVDLADAGLGTFDTVVMLGNNFGLVGTRERAPEVLGTLADVTAEDARVLAESRDPRATDDPDHLAYHERNRERGRLPGALRIRVRYRTYATDWYDYLLAAPDTVRDLVDGTAWAVAEVVGDGHEDTGTPGEDGDYVAVLGRA